MRARRYLSIGCGVIVLLLTLLVWSFAPAPTGIRRPMESSTAFHLRMMKWHGKETKNLAEQARHGDLVVKLGDDALPYLALEIADYGASMGVRYDPSPSEMLRAIGQPAHDYLLAVLEANRIEHGLSTTTLSAVERRELIFLLAREFDDWQYFDERLNVKDASGHSTYPIQNRRMEGVVIGRFGASKVPHMFLGDSYGPSMNTRIDPAFVKWWARTRPDVVKSKKLAPE